MALTTLACEHTLDVGHDLASDGASATNRANDGTSSEAGPTDASAADGSCAAICDKLLSCGYADAEDTTKCNAQCAATPRSLLDCIAASTCQTLVTCPMSMFEAPETGSSGNSAPCKLACDDLKFFSCISAADHANCRGLCDTKPDDARDTFIQCKEATSSCKDRVDCYDQFTK